MADYTAFPSSTGPGTSTADSPVNLGLEFSVSSTAWLKGIRFWRADLDQDGAIQCACWNVVTASTGTIVSGSVGTYDLDGTGWQDHLYDTPLPLTVDQPYKAAVFFPSGYPATGAYWAPGGPGEGGVTQGPLVVPDAAGGTGGVQCSYGYNSVVEYPDNGGTANYWVTPIITDIDPAGPRTGSGTAALALGATAAAIAVRSGASSAQIGLAVAGAASHRGVGALAAALQLGGAGAGTHLGSGARTAALALSAVALLPGRDIDVLVGELETAWSATLMDSRWTMEAD